MSHSSIGSEDRLKLETWGLPDYVLKKYAEKGITTMFPWQVECLMSPNVLEGGNLIYSAPTSAGKTLVAEILTLKTILERKKKTIIILPFVSVVREKKLYFQEILSGSGIRVEGFMGSYNPPGGFRAVHLAVCTIEKANNLINRLLEEQNFDDVGSIVVDELHLIGDPSRGYLLELLLTKIKYIHLNQSNSIQIIGMSATLPNLDILSNWLDASLYKTDFRPIPLNEYLKVGNAIYNSDLSLKCELNPEISIMNDNGDVIYLCIDTILKGFSILIFCSTKNWCETLAQQISLEIRRLGMAKDETGNALREQLNSNAISDVLEQLKKCPVGLETTLGRSVSFGVGYHHAGLTMEERDIVENAFRNNTVRVLVATSTLASGVNLPARRVLIRSPMFAGKIMDMMTYKQMIGRAGRMGKDSEGESYLICSEADKYFGQQLISSQLPPVKSCLGLGNFSACLKRAILEVVASGLVKTKQDIHLYAQCTLLSETEESTTLVNIVDTCIEFLCDMGFMTINDSIIVATNLAEACFSASIPPDQGLDLIAELDRARKCFVLDTDLHAIYQVTPYSICSYYNVDWMKVFSIWEGLPEVAKKVGRLVGVEEKFLIKALRSSVMGSEYILKTMIHKRFYAALALQDLIKEMPLKQVSEKYGCNKGVLQSLQQSASSFSGMVTNFCHRLNWGAMEVVLAELSQRIQFGVQRDLLDLMKLDCMTSVLARSLYKSGITTLSELANSILEQVQKAIRQATPFEKEIKDPGTRRDICLPGRPGLTDLEAADFFIFEARRFLLHDIGLKDASWSQKSKTEKSTLQLSKIIKIDESFASQEMKNVKLSLSSNKSVGIFPLSQETQPYSIVPETQDLEESIQKFSADKILDSNKNSPNLRFSLTNLKSSTPVSTPNNENESDSDMFENSPVIEDVDPNLGGESLLQASFLSGSIEIESPLEPKPKRKCLGISTEKYFESFNFDFENKKKSIPVKKSSLTESFLLKAFEDSFENKQQIASCSKNKDLDSEEDLFSSCIDEKAVKTSPFSSPSRTPKKKRTPSKYPSVSCVRRPILSPRRRTPSKIINSKHNEIMLCDNEAETKIFMQNLQNIGQCAFLVESKDCDQNKIGSSLIKRRSKTYGYMQSYFTWGEQVYILNFQKSGCSCMNTLIKIFEIEELKLITYNVKDQLKLIHKNFKIIINCTLIDILIADWLLEPTLRSFNDLAKNQQIYENSNLSIKNVCLTWSLYKDLAIKLKNAGLFHIFKDIEMPVQLCLVEMENKGMILDQIKANTLWTEVCDEMSKLEVEAFRIAGKKFNLSTNAAIKKLDKILHNNVTLRRIIEDWRSLNSLKTRNLSQLLFVEWENARCRSSSSSLTATGRIVMCEPDLQHIPRNFYVFDKLFSPRSLFKADKDKLFVSADFNQLELRILAHFAHDLKLFSLFKSEADVFITIAADWNNLKLEQVTDDIRQQTKKIVYGILYGMGDSSLGNSLGTNTADASMLSAKFKRAYPGVQQFIHKCINNCKENGYITTIAGRKRFLPDINSQNNALRSKAERQALNSTIQGSAADIAKKSMVNINKRIKLLHLEENCSLVLQLHDEFIYEVSKTNIDEVKRLVKFEMENTTKLYVPLPVTIKIGPTWGEMEKIL